MAGEAQGSATHRDPGTHDLSRYQPGHGQIRAPGQRTKRNPKAKPPGHRNRETDESNYRRCGPHGNDLTHTVVLHQARRSARRGRQASSSTHPPVERPAPGTPNLSRKDTAMNTMSLTQKFAAEYAEGVVPAMLKAINAAKRDTRLIVAGVLAITYHHQAHWLSTIDGIGILGWVIPAVVDLAMLRMLGIVQTTGMKRPAKKAALVMTGFLSVMSAAVNIAAPGAVAARVIFGALVLIAAGVKVVTALVGPDFAEMEQTENAAQSAAPATTEAVDAELVAKRKASAAKGVATRKEREAREAAEKAAKVEERRLARELKKLEQLAPTSPGHPAVMLSAADREVLAAHMPR